MKSSSWSTLKYSCVDNIPRFPPSQNYSRLPGDGPSFARGYIHRVIVEAHESASHHSFGMSTTYLRSAELLRFVRQLGYNVVGLGLSSAV